MDIFTDARIKQLEKNEIDFVILENFLEIIDVHLPAEDFFSSHGGGDFCNLFGLSFPEERFGMTRELGVLSD